MSLGQAATPKTPQQLERANQIVASFRDVYKKSCRAITSKPQSKRHLNSANMAPIPREWIRAGGKS